MQCSCTVKTWFRKSDQIARKIDRQAFTFTPTAIQMQPTLGHTIVLRYKCGQTRPVDGRRFSSGLTSNTNHVRVGQRGHDMLVSVVYRSTKRRYKDGPYSLLFFQLQPFQGWRAPRSLAPATLYCQKLRNSQLSRRTYASSA